MCAKSDSARAVQQCAEKLQAACAQLAAFKVDEELPDWAEALLAELDRDSSSVSNS